MISRRLVFLLGLLGAGLATGAIVLPLWYLASRQRFLFNELFLVALCVFFGRRLLSRILRSRRRKVGRGGVPS